uniref:Ig-like domain-containing protein n=1 Tax=Anabas testudineus TaxID=64144 RepID=A0AAQ6IDB0_ANATE
KCGCRSAAVLPQAEEEVEAEEGDDVILKCQLDPEDDVRKSPVTWSKDERKNIVHVYRLGQDHAEDQKEVFRNRTVLHHEGLKKGNVTLQLFSVRLSDNGRFICYIRRLDAYCYVILKVVRRGQLNRSVGSVVSTATSQPEVEPGDLGVATVNHPFPPHSIMNIFYPNTSQPHVLCYNIHISPPWSSSCPPAWQLHLQHPSTNILTIPPLNMSKPPQSGLSDFVANTDNVSRPSDVLVPYSV